MLLVFAAVQVLASIFAFIFYRLRPDARWAFLWFLGQLSTTIAGILQLTRIIDQVPLVIALQNILFFLGALLFYHAIWTVRISRPFPMVIYFLLPLYTLIFAGLMPLHFQIRTVYVAICYGVVSSFTGYLVLNDAPTHFRSAARIISFGFLAMALGNGYRIVEAFFIPQSLGVGYIDSQPLGLSMFLGSLVTIWILIGFSILSNKQLEAENSFTQQQLEQRNNDLAQLNTLHRRVLSIVGHDLKTPLQGVLRYMGKFLLAPNVDLKHKREALEIIQDTLERSDALLENLLLWGATSDERNKLNVESFDIIELIEHNLGLLDESAKNKAIEFELTYDDGNKTCNSDKTMIGVVVRNLVSNAIKFSYTNSSIFIQVQLDSPEEVYIRIVDQGTGMDAKRIQRDIGRQEPITTIGTAGERGHGLGLSLSMELARTLGGNLSLESALGHGTNAILLLPRSPHLHAYDASSLNR